MKALRCLFISQACVVVGLIACATGGGSESEEEGGASPTTTVTTTGETTTTTSDTTSTSSTGQGGGEPCPPPQHQCGQICASNGPQTGCYQSTSCTPCPSVVNGTTTCSADGLCDVICIAPYEKEGMACACPFECCTAVDCTTAGANCNTDSHTCFVPCDPIACLMNFACIILDQIGQCTDQGCICVDSGTGGAGGGA